MPAPPLGSFAAAFRDQSSLVYPVYPVGLEQIADPMMQVPGLEGWRQPAGHAKAQTPVAPSAMARTAKPPNALPLPLQMTRTPGPAAIRVQTPAPQRRFNWSRTALLRTPSPFMNRRIPHSPDAFPMPRVPIETQTFPTNGVDAFQENCNPVFKRPTGIRQVMMANWIPAEVVRSWSPAPAGFWARRSPTLLARPGIRFACWCAHRARQPISIAATSRGRRLRQIAPR